MNSSSGMLQLAYAKLVYSIWRVMDKVACEAKSTYRCMIVSRSTIDELMESRCIMMC